MKTRVVQGDGPSLPPRPPGGGVPPERQRTGEDSVDVRTGRTGRQVLRAAQAARTHRDRIPFTLSVALLTLLAGLPTTALWRPRRTQPLMDGVAYGLPALSEGRWWTPATGVLFAQTPLQYLATLGSFVILCGFAEYRLGTLRAIVTATGAQRAGVLGAAAILAVAQGHGWLWADRTALVRDLGFSAGALGAASAANATPAPPLRGRAPGGRGTSV